MCQFSALRIQHIREMPGQNRRPQCLNAQRVEIAASLKIGARSLVKRNQMTRIVVHAHDRAASRQQRGSHVLPPLGEPVLKLRNELLHRLRRNAAFAGQDPQPIGLGAAFFQRIRHPVQRILKRPEDLGQQTAGQSRPGLPHGQQEIGGIGRDQHVGLPAGPEGHAPPIQRRLDALHGLVHAFPGELARRVRRPARIGKQFGPIHEQRVRHGPADALFRTSVRIGVKITDQPTQRGQGQRRNGSGTLGFVGVQLAPCLQNRGGGGRPDAQTFAQGRSRTHGQRCGTDSPVSGGIGHGKTQFRVAGHIPDLDAERNHPFGTRAYGYFNGRRGNHAQGLVRRQRQRKGSRLSRIVGDGKRGVELVARRSQNRKLRRQNHRAAHRGVGFGAARRIRRRRHRHDANAAVVIAGNGDGDGRLSPHLHDAGPPAQGRFGLALERIVEPPAGQGHIAAEGRDAELAVIRHEQIEHLPRLHFQRPVVEQITQRIGRGESGELKHALIHGENQRLPRMAGGQGYRESAAGQHLFRSLEPEPHVPPRHIHGERSHRVTVRLHEHVGRGQGTGQRHVDIGAALEILGNRDFLHAVPGADAEPAGSRNAVALQRDQAHAVVRRRQEQPDGFAGRIVRLVDVQAQVAGGQFVPPGEAQVVVARHREGHEGHDLAGGVPHAEQEFAGLVRGHGPRQIAGRVERPL